MKGDADIGAIKVNDADDLYAHDSDFIIKEINGIEYLFLFYTYDKTTPIEGQSTQHNLLKIFLLESYTLVKTFELFYAGLSIMPEGKVVGIPRMYFYENYIRCFCNNSNTLFTRDIDISDNDPNNWIAGNISIAQMTMKNADGDDVMADVTSANINIHLDYVFGDDYAGYHDLMPMFRNLIPAIKGDNWYSTIELSGELSHNLPGPTLLITSNDAGNTWKFGSPIGYNTSNRLKVIEPGIIFLETDLHVISRGSQPIHCKSVDLGVTWIRETDLPFACRPAKPTATNYINDLAQQKNIMAWNLISEIVGNTDRTTLGIYYTDDFIKYSLIRKIITATYCHYPSLRYYEGDFYMSYTKGVPEGSGTDRNAIYITKFNV